MVRANFLKTISQLLLLVYAFGVLKPLSPIINDVLAHTFWKMQHIATVHYENGKYHVHTELAEEGKKQEHSSPSVVSSGALMEAHTNNAPQTLAYSSAEEKTFYIPAVGACRAAFCSLNNPPPERA